MTENKILIVGAGPSGLTLAVELVRRGIGFRIIDKAAGPAPMIESRALAVNARTQQILEPSGVGEHIRGSGHLVKHIHLCWKGNLRHKVILTNTPAIAGSEFRSELIILRQGLVERCLQDNLNARGISVEWNRSLIALSMNKGKALVQLRKTDGSEEELNFDTVVGCDGAHSIVRKQSGYTFNGESDENRWSLADVTLRSENYAHSLTADLRPGKAFASIALGGKQIRLIHNGLDILNQHPLAGEVDTVEWESDFRVSYRMVKLFNRGNSYLCGDAAHIHSPVGGRGMNLGIEDAATLAYLLSQNRQHEYSERRSIVAKKVLKLTHNQTKQMNSSSLISSILKKHGPRLLNIARVRDAVLDGVLGLDTTAPEWLRKDGVNSRFFST